jgi:hypothetical protein
MPFPLAEQYIIAAEQALGAMLPPHYREAIARCNGGEVEAEYDVWQLHPLEDRSDKKRLARSGNHVVRETEQAKKWATFPTEAISIASNGTGDLLVLLRDGAAFSDTVYLWSHETGTVKQVAQGIHEIAVAS